MTKREPVRLTAAAQRFAERLNRLFTERRASDGHEYTLAEISAATDGRLSIPYLSMLRKGVVAHPRSDKLALLADFFGVDPRYFTSASTGEVAPASELPAELLHALENPWVRSFALRTTDMGQEDFETLITVWEYSHSRRRLRHQSSSDADAPSESPGGTDEA